MGKNIVLCSDGTGNSGGKRNGTNVWRIYGALDLNGHKWDPQIPEQVAFHDDGVGTDDLKWLKLLGGAFGVGLKRNLRQIYCFLANNYQPGDQIFIFGFSRGAYTARALAGLIGVCGIIDAAACASAKEMKAKADQAIRILRGHFHLGATKNWGKERLSKKAVRYQVLAKEFRGEHAVCHEQLAPKGVVPIRFVGVWDTVDAYGLPWDRLADLINFLLYPFRFPDRKLGPQVQRAAHALAIDDERDTFHPVIWDESEEQSGRLSQVWFAGMHSNVGGGYPKDGMAYVSLDWMMAEAEKPLATGEQGLCFLRHKREEARSGANVLAKMYDSRAGVGSFYRYNPRNIEELCKQNGIARPKIHDSVFHRATARIDGYAPGNLPAKFEEVGTSWDHLHQGAFAKGSLGAFAAEAPPLSGEKSPSQVLAGAIRLRKLLHYLLTFLIAAILAYSLIWAPEPESIPSLPKMFQMIPYSDWLFKNIVLKLWANTRLFFGIAGALLLIWSTGWLAKRKIRNYLAKHWLQISKKQSAKS